MATKRLFESTAISFQNYQDYEHIRQNCVTRGRLFKDPLFRASDKSLAWEDAQNHTESIGFVMKKSPVVWMRPHVSSDTSFIFFLKNVLCQLFFNSKMLTRLAKIFIFLKNGFCPHGFK